MDMLCEYGYVNKENDFPNCYKCGCKSDESPLWSLDAPGIYFLCENCIKKIEKEENKKALFSPFSGTSFVSNK